MRKIVVPTDFSENAFNALRYAVELFKYEKSEFFLLHAYAEEVYSNDDDLSTDITEGLKEDLLQPSGDKLEKLLKEIKDLSPNPKHHFILVPAFGLLIDEVSDLINRENADLAVMGTRGRTNDRKITFGSNTLQVIKYVQSPVLCIPESYTYKVPEKILFPTNYLLPYQRRELKLGAELARKFCAEIHLLFISRLFPVSSTRQKENQIFLKDQFYQVHLAFHNRNETDKVKAIIKFIDQMKIDLLVMVNSRQIYLENMLSESTNDKLCLSPGIPFLVLQNFQRN